MVRALAAAALLAAAPSAWADGNVPGVARISDGGVSAVVPVSHSHSSCVPSCAPEKPSCCPTPGGCQDCCRDCDDGCCLHRLFHRDGCHHGHDCDECDHCHDGHCHDGHWSHLGMFHPLALLHTLKHSGHGLCPVGVYSHAYPVNPNYFDARDGRVYAAQGYGIPVSVPLAPQVDFTYNYGWGIPASRLTPIWK
jgi:hypothetical protein